MIYFHKKFWNTKINWKGVVLHVLICHQVSCLYLHTVGQIRARLKALEFEFLWPRDKIRSFPRAHFASCWQSDIWPVTCLTGHRYGGKLGNTQCFSHFKLRQSHWHFIIVCSAELLPFGWKNAWPPNSVWHNGLFAFAGGQMTTTVFCKDMDGATTSETNSCLSGY